MKTEDTLNLFKPLWLIALFTLIVSTPLNTVAQISGGGIKTTKTKEKKDKKKNKETTNKVKEPFNADSLSGSIFYIHGFAQRSFREFEDQSPFNMFEQQNDEIPLITGGTNVGIILPLYKNLSLDIGITYFGHGEALNFEDELSDSTFSYRNVYTQVGVPLKIRYNTEGDFQFFGFAGITPLNILSTRFKSEFTRVSGLLIEQPVEVSREGFTTFNAMASIGAGINYYYHELGFTIYPEYRRHLFNTFGEDTFQRSHKMFGFALNFGINFRL